MASLFRLRVLCLLALLPAPAGSLLRSALNATVSKATPFLIRYAILNPTKNEASLSKQLSLLQQSLCTAEQRLTPLLVREPAFGTQPKYVVYVDHSSEGHVVVAMRNMGIAGQRLSIVNLDKDPGDAYRLAQVSGLASLDQLNQASVRRALADSVHLPPSHARLLLGTDISFIQDPVDFTYAAARLLCNQAAYLLDDRFPFFMNSYVGPQCPGMLGDFVYSSPGLNVDTATATLVNKMQ